MRMHVQVLRRYNPLTNPPIILVNNQLFQHIQCNILTDDHNLHPKIPDDNINAHATCIDALPTETKEELSAFPLGKLELSPGEPLPLMSS